MDKIKITQLTKIFLNFFFLKLILFLCLNVSNNEPDGKQKKMTNIKCVDLQKISIYT